ncbi:AAA family ATPase [Nibricoccus sp. IMCC34717]|uniref:AAA family ATPase n=1 Tax=Nibricoccus sp. IMCC34717 TaxID=3034021 RepID=UPI00384E4787
MHDSAQSPLLPEGLREALRLSPDNAPLLLHAADTLLTAKAFPDAEALFKRALACDAALDGARLGLATAFFQQGKAGAALVLVEDMVARPSPTPDLLLLHARLAFHTGERALAASQYQRAVVAKPALRDPALERALADHLPALTSLSSPSSPSSLSSLSFSDVGGMEAVKQEIRLKIILPLQQPDLFKAYGKKIGGGILLYGPPGCGKTHLARATAGEVNAAFHSVGLNDVLDMWVGQSEKNLHAIFDHARASRPSVLFFDEVDALGANRTDLLKSAGRQIINQFLAELDGLQASNEGVLILAATNAPWHLDPAFRRPGRFDRILFVPPPDEAARETILSVLLRGKPTDSIDVRLVARKTDGFSGADLKAVVDIAVEGKLGEALKSGRIEPLTEKDLLSAAKRHKPTVRDWFETARNYALYANQSGLYDDIRAYLKLDA